MSDLERFAESFKLDLTVRFLRSCLTLMVLCVVIYISGVLNHARIPRSCIFATYCDAVDLKAPLIKISTQTLHAVGYLSYDVSQKRLAWQLGQFATQQAFQAIKNGLLLSFVVVRHAVMLVIQILHF